MTGSVARLARSALEIVSLVARAASRSRSMLPVSTDWFVTRNVSTSDTVCAPAGDAAISRTAAASQLVRRSSIVIVSPCGGECSDALTLPLDCIVPAPRRHGRCASRRNSPFLKSVDRSTAIVVPLTEKVTVGHRPDRPDTDPSNSTFFGAGVGGRSWRCRSRRSRSWRRSRRCRSRRSGRSRWCRSRRSRSSAAGGAGVGAGDGAGAGVGAGVGSGGGAAA